MSLRVVALGARDFAPDATAPGAAVWSLVASHAWRRFELGLDVENLFDATWREQESYGEVRTSRFASDAYDDVRYSPGAAHRRRLG